MKKKTILIVLVILIAIIALAVYMTNAGKQERLEEQARAQQYINDNIYYTGTVTELSNMSDDEKDALINKHIVVTGTYGNDSNSLYVKLSDNDFAVKAYMDDVPKIENDSIVTVDGVCTYVADSKIKMFLCTVTNIEEPIAVETEAVELSEMPELSETEESSVEQIAEMTAETSSSVPEKETSILVESVATLESEEESDSENTKTEDNNKDNQSDSLTQNETVSETVNDGMVHLGETFVYGNFEITFEDYDADWTGYKFSLRPSKGNKYIRLGLYIRNNGEDEQELYGSNFECYADNMATQYGSYVADDSLDLIQLSSGRETRGAIYFEVPEDAQSVEVEITYPHSKSDKIIIKCE